MKNRLGRGSDGSCIRIAGVIALGCVAMIGFSSQAAWSAEGANLAPNPGFENANFPGTDYLVQSKDHVKLVTEQPYEGRQCLRHDAVPGHDMNTVQMYEAMIPCRTGQIYRLAVQSRNTLRGADPMFGLREANGVTSQQQDAYPGGDSICYTWRRIPAGRSVWEQYELIVRPRSNTKILQIYLCVPAYAKSGSVWWDAVSVTEEPDPFINLPATNATGPSVVHLLPTLVLDHTDAGTKPEALPIWIQAVGRAVGGALSISLSKIEKPDEALWSYATRLDNEGLYNPVVPTVKLKDGRYRLRIECESPDRTTIWREDKPLAVLNDKPPAPLEPIQSVLVNSDIDLCVNGKPFPMTLFFHNPLNLESLTELHQRYGANTASVWGGDSIDVLCTNVDMAWKAGLYSFAVLFHPATFDAQSKRFKDDALIETVTRLKNHPGLIGYDLYDEPDAAGVTTQELARAEALVRKLDPKHVIWVNLVATHLWKDYAKFGDFLSFDHYPLPNGSLDEIRSRSRRIRAASPRPKPLLVVQQTWAMPVAGVAALPTLQQLRAETYMNICDGMKLFTYYSWYDPSPSISLWQDPELRSATRLINWEIQRLTPFLYETRKLAVDASIPQDAKFVTLAKETKDGIFLIAVNYVEKNVSRVTLGLTGRKIAKAKHLFDGRPVKVENGKIVDDFPAFTVEVYKIE